jgi:hypothetical protein
MHMHHIVVLKNQLEAVISYSIHITIIVIIIQQPYNKTKVIAINN